MPLFLFSATVQALFSWASRLLSSAVSTLWNTIQSLRPTTAGTASGFLPLTLLTSLPLMDLLWECLAELARLMVRPSLYVVLALTFGYAEHRQHSYDVAKARAEVAKVNVDVDAFNAQIAAAIAERDAAREQAFAASRGKGGGCKPPDAVIDRLNRILN